LEIVLSLLTNTASSYTALNVALIIVWIFGLIPLSLLGFWFFNRAEIEKLFFSPRLAEPSLKGKEKTPAKTEQGEPEETEQEKLKREFRNRAM
jgi:hypothetical protein